MPGPASSTEKRTSRPWGRAATRTVDAGGPYLKAFSSRLRNTWVSRLGSAMTLVSARSCSTVMPLASAIWPQARRASATAGAGSTGAASMAARPLSRRERESRSSIIRAMWSAFLSRISKKLRARLGSASGLSMRASAYPLMVVSGVRSSCETLATKSRRTRSRRLSSLMSWNTARAPMPLSLSRAGTRCTS